MRKATRYDGRSTGSTPIFEDDEMPIDRPRLAVELDEHGIAEAGPRGVGLAGHPDGAGLEQRAAAPGDGRLRRAHDARHLAPGRAPVQLEGDRDPPI